MTFHLPERDACQYASCYCEENVYKLIKNLNSKSPDVLSNAYVVFISNENRCVPLWNQRAGREEDGLTLWDYHVILLYKGVDLQSTLVYDLDTRLPFPVELPLYLVKAICNDDGLEENFHRKFRVIPGAEYLCNLSSDRRHMKSDDGWMQLPPSWSCIQGKENISHNLDTFISMAEGVGVGTVMNLSTFVKTFS